jgi:hypothetical protein
MENKWILIHTFEKKYLAEIAKEVMFDNGIEAMIFDKSDSSYTLFSRIELYVTEENIEKSVELIKQIEN